LAAQDFSLSLSKQPWFAMRHRPPPRRVENYTSAFLVSFGVLIFMSFWTIATLAGFIWVLISTAVFEGALRLVAQRRG